jgi:4-hydroxybenzoate polyprenyltransferase
MYKRFEDFLIISRANIQISSLPTAALGIVLGAKDWRDLMSGDVVLFISLFFVILTFSCNMNCLADVGVDAKFKTRLSDSVRSLGPAKIKIFLGVEAVLAAGLCIALALSRKNALFLLGAGALGAGYVYSAPPFRLKKRGWLGLLPVMVGLYALPPAAGFFLMRGRLSWFILAFSMGYAFLMEGITLINTCEDYAEDEAAGIRTLAHVLGIRRTLTLGAWLSAAGGAIDLFLILGVKADGTSMNLGKIFGLIFVGAFFAWAVISIVRVFRRIARSDDPAAQSKAHGRLMRIWFLKTRYSLLIMALFLVG